LRHPVIAPARKPARTRPVAAGAVYFAVVFAAGFVLGSVRVLLVVPRTGVRAAELAEAPLMLWVTIVAARFVVRRFAMPPVLLTRLVTGCTALGLLLLAELGMVVLVQQQTLGGYVASRDPVSGSVYVGLLCLYALMPAILARRPAARAGRLGSRP
jgi:hypothetical protein